MRVDQQGLLMRISCAGDEVSARMFVLPYPALLRGLHTLRG
jgi:hypothetical protein